MIRLLAIAWKNIWRNKLRSITLIAAISIGLWSGLFSSALVIGVNNQRTEGIIENQTGHIQIAHPEFSENQALNFQIKNPEIINNILDNEENIASYSTKILTNGMAASPNTSQPVTIQGIDPELEKEYSRLDQKVVDGTYFEGIKRNPILIGVALAKELNIRVKKKIVLTFHNQDGDITSTSFRIAGLYKTGDTRMDKMNVFVRKQDLSKDLAIGNSIHKIFIMVEDETLLAETSLFLSNKLPDYSVKNWKEVLPWLSTASTMVDRSNYYLLAIILLALSFGIVNTMLMSVLERVKEFGMLMAVGMTKAKVFFMILLETIFIMLTAMPIGLLIGYLTISHYSKEGIDLSSYSEGFENVGLNPIIYTELTTDYYWLIFILVIISAILSALYPALKAIRLNPAEAIRKI